MNLKRNMLSERSHTEKTEYCVLLFIENSRQYTKHMVARGLERGDEVRRGITRAQRIFQGIGYVHYLYGGKGRLGIHICQKFSSCKL